MTKVCWFICLFNPLWGRYYYSSFVEGILRLREINLFVRFQIASRVVGLGFGTWHFDINLKHFSSQFASLKQNMVLILSAALFPLTLEGQCPRYTSSASTMVWHMGSLWCLLTATTCWSGSCRLPLVGTAVYFHTLPSEAEAQRDERATRRSCNCEIAVLDNSSSQKTHISFLHTHLYFLWSIWEDVVYWEKSIKFAVRKTWIKNLNFIRYYEGVCLRITWRHWISVFTTLSGDWHEFLP